MYGVTGCLASKRVESLDRDLLVAVRGGLEDRAQLTLEAAQRPGVALDHLGPQPVAVGQQLVETLVTLEGCVDQARGALGVTDEVHGNILRGAAVR